MPILFWLMFTNQILMVKKISLNLSWWYGLLLFILKNFTSSFRIIRSLTNYEFWPQNIDSEFAKFLNKDIENVTLHYAHQCRHIIQKSEGAVVMGWA